MTNFLPSSAAILIMMLITSAFSYAEDSCQYDMPAIYEATSPKPSLEIVGEYPIKMSDRFLRSKHPVSVFTGDYKITLKKMNFNTKSLFLKARGLVLSSLQFVIKAESAVMNLSNHSGKLNNVDYWIQHEYVVSNGKANSAAWQDKQLLLQRATYTQCPPNKRIWEFYAKSVTVPKGSKYVDLELPGLKLFGWDLGQVSQRLRFPVGTERASGWLPPQVSINSRLGLGVGLPYYHVIDPFSDVELTSIFYTRPALTLHTFYRLVSGDFYYSLNGYFVPFDRTDDNSQNSRYAMALKIKSDPRLSWKLIGNFGYVGDKWWTRDYTYVDRENQSFIPSNLEISHQSLNEYWRLLFRRFQYLDTGLDSLFVYERLPEINYRKIIPVDQSTQFIFEEDAVIFSPKGHSDQELTSGFRSTGEVGILHLQRDRFLVEQSIKVRWLLHSKSHKTGQFVMAPDMKFSIGEDFMEGEALLSPSVSFHWVPFSDQSDTPIYDGVSIGDLSFESNQLAQDRIFDRSDIQLKLAVSKANSQFTVSGRYAVNLHQTCVDPNCEIDWLAKHHMSPLSIEWVGNLESQIFNVKSEWVNEAPYMNLLVMNVSGESNALKYTLGYEWHRQYYNLNKQNTISGASRLMLDLLANIDDKWQLDLKPNVIFDGRTRLGYDAAMKYRDCCFAASINLSLSPRTYDGLMRFSHRPELSFQMSLSPL
tara:strand:+ start:100 stop:2211 length:2112 start_codon:yes stop_codon:yes gene_type:complete